MLRSVLSEQSVNETSRASAATVEALGVSRLFSDRKVVDGFTVSLPPGRIHALLGPNAAGKTTLLRMLAGLTAPSSGSVLVLGDTPANASIRSRIGWVASNDRAFYLRLGGRENLMFFARLYGAGRVDAKRRAEELLELVGLGDVARQPVRTYSHGMIKRLAVARGLLNDPALLVVDEATHDLDPAGAERVRGLMREACERGTTVVWATQRIDEIRGFAETVTVLDRGKTSFQGEVDELVARALSRVYILRLTDGAPRDETALSTAVSHWGIIDRHQRLRDRWLLSLKPDAVLSDVFAALSGVGARVHSCSEERSELEDAFLVITGATSGEER